MNSIKKQAHIAGVLYVLASIAAVFAWIYVDGKIFVRDDASAMTQQRLPITFALPRLFFGLESRAS